MASKVPPRTNGLCLCFFFFFFFFFFGGAFFLLFFFFFFLPSPMPSHPHASAMSDATNATAMDDSEAAGTPGRSGEKRIRRVNPKFADSGDSLGFIGDTATPKSGKRKRSDSVDNGSKRRKVDPALDAEEIKRKKMELEKQMREIDSQLQTLEPTPSPAAKPTPKKKKKSTKASPAPTPAAAPKALPTPKKKAAPKATKASKSTPAGGRTKRVTARKKSISVPPNNELLRVLRKCRKAVADTLNHKYAWPFSEPVDAEKLGLWDYHTIVTEPMDLGTVLKKIDAHEYESLEDVCSDVSLVWGNCMKYNLPGSDIYVMCETLKDVWEKNIAKVRRDEERLAAKAASRAAARRSTPSSSTPKPKAIASSLGTSSSDAVNEIISLRESVQALQAQIERLQGEPVTPAKRDPDLIPMTREEKQKLSNAIQHRSLGPEHLGVILQMIQESMPDLATAGEEIEIDLDALDTVTLRKLERYVETACKPEKKKKKKKPRVGRAAPSSAGTPAPVKPSTPAPSKPKPPPKDEDVMIDVDDSAASEPAEPVAKPPPASSVTVEKVAESASSGSDSDGSGTDSDSSSDGDFGTLSSSSKPALSAASPTAPAPTTSSSAKPSANEPKKSGDDRAKPPAADSAALDTSADQVSFAVQPELAEKDPAALNSAMDTEEPASTEDAADEAPKAEVKDMELENADAWDPSEFEESGSTGAESTKLAASAGGGGGEKEPLWSAFKEKEQALREKQRERDERERLAQEKQKALEEEQERLLQEQREKEEREREEAEKAKELEQQRLEEELAEKRRAARKEREKKASSTAINLNEQSQMMAAFEMQTGRMG
eukprot:TRINITY_DN44_c1_g1_i1.p1 TRINITY_DN44_c1_g1~~TRINITY_DN44_c1_g1_i1.p1  ORF type:complete len:831 (-),score=228.61 TRINITY_DN44_c1_g1_i1:431-2923(-)